MYDAPRPHTPICAVLINILKHIYHVARTAPSRHQLRLVSRTGPNVLWKDYKNYVVSTVDNVVDENEPLEEKYAKMKKSLKRKHV